jgi:beta-lactamase class A
MENTFIATPFVDDPDKKPTDIPFINTPAREAANVGTCVNTFAIFDAQTTTRDLAALFDLIYQCAEYGGGGLVAAYPTEITQDECKTMVAFLETNSAGGLISAGLPADVQVAHKHGWVADTHSDSGIVYGPSGDYVISMFLWTDVTNPMPVSQSFPVMEGISTATFNYFNPSMVNTPRIGLGDLINIDTETTQP